MTTFSYFVFVRPYFDLEEEFPIEHFRNKMKRSWLSLNWLWREQTNWVFYFTSPCNVITVICQSQIKHVLAPKLLSLCYKCPCCELRVHRVGKFAIGFKHSRSRATSRRGLLLILLQTLSVHPFNPTWTNSSVLHLVVSSLPLFLLPVGVHFKAIFVVFFIGHHQFMSKPS